MLSLTKSSKMIIQIQSMDNLETSYNMIKIQMKRIKQSLSEFESEKTRSLKIRKSQKIKADLNSIKSQLNVFEMDLENFSQTQKTTKYNDFINKKSQKISQILLFLSIFENPASNSMFSDNLTSFESDKTTDNLSKDDLIMNVDVAYEEANEDCHSILQNLEEGKTILSDIQKEIAEQEERLLKFKHEIDEMYSVTQQTKKMVRYFQIQIMKDKFIIGLFVIVVVALLIVIGLKIAGYKSDNTSIKAADKSSLENSYHH